MSLGLKIVLAHRYVVKEQNLIINELLRLGCSIHKKPKDVSLGLAKAWNNLWKNMILRRKLKMN